jgi:glutathione S-transferase
MRDEPEYVVYGGAISLFTRKLEAALRFYAIPHRHEGKKPGVDDVEERAGTHQIPVLHTPENWMLADTTPILSLLDARIPSRRMFPTGPLGVLVHVCEEVLDEWFARVMVHYRWHYLENTRHIVAGFLGREPTDDEARDFPIANWGRRACRATGTESEAAQRAAEAEYHAMLAALETQLGKTRYALGDRPCAVDTIVLGGLRAHINSDPIPELPQYPNTLAWDAELADRWTGNGALASFPESTPFASHLLEVARDQYAPFALANARALAAGDKAFEIETLGTKVSYLARPYPERSRRMVQARIRHQLDAGERSRVQEWLESWSLAELFGT